jgi:hypothetical protein
MNKRPKPKTALSREELLQAMEPVRYLIPNGNFDKFFDRVDVAIEIYLDSDELSLVAKELRNIDRICRNPNYTLLHVLKGTSKTTRELLEGANLLDGPNPLPPLPNIEDEAGIAALAKEIRQRIIISMKPQPDRKRYRLVGPSGKFRPPKYRLRVLVSFIAAAYTEATGESYRREWASDDTLPFHLILNVIFDTLGIEASVDEAIRRQKRSSL